MTELAAAINRAYHAWIKTQPQLILDLWGDNDGLHEPDCATSGGVVRLVEPAVSPFGGFPSGHGTADLRLPADDGPQYAVAALTPLSLEV